MDAELNELVEEDVAAKLSGLDIPSGSAAAVDPVMPVVDQPASGALCEIRAIFRLPSSLPVSKSHQ